MDEAHSEALTFWNGFAESYNARPGHRTITLVPQLVGDLAGALGGAFVVDLACGAGRGSRMLAEEVGDDGLVLAIDLTPAMLEAAEAENGLPNIEYLEAPAEATGLSDDAADHLFCCLGLMLFPDARSALVEGRRVVKPGGTFRAAVWGDPAHSSMMTLAGEAAERLGITLPKPERSNFYLGTDEALRAECEGTGWTLRESRKSAVTWPYEDAAEACKDLGYTVEDPSPRMLPAVGEERWPAFCAAVEEVAAERLAADGVLRLDITLATFA